MTIKPTVYIDSCLIIDLVKVKRNVTVDGSRHSESWFVERILEAARDGEIRLIASTIALVECLRADEVMPDPVAEETKQLIRDFLWSGEMIELVAFDLFVAERARDLRWVDNVKIQNADAIHIATGLLEGATEFLTTDEKLKARYAPLLEKMRGDGMFAIVPSATASLSQERRSADMFPPAQNPHEKSDGREA